MDRKQELAMAIRSQFMRPRRFAGWLVGWEMALRSSNRKRNVWAVGLLGVEPTDRVLHSLMRPGGRIAIVSQPRCPGATAETTVAAGREIGRRLTGAGFTCIWSDTLALKPPRRLRDRRGPMISLSLPGSSAAPALREGWPNSCGEH